MPYPTLSSFLCLVPFFLEAERIHQYSNYILKDVWMFGVCIGWKVEMMFDDIIVVGRRGSDFFQQLCLFIGALIGYVRMRHTI